MGIAFVFSGEAARGAFQAGVAKELALKNIYADAVYGTSSGAINATGYSYIGPKKLAEEWKKINHLKKVFGFNGISSLWKSGIFNAKPLLELLSPIITQNPYQIPVTVSKVHIYKGFVKYVSNKETSDISFLNSVVASASLPGIVEPMFGCWSDGGILVQAPLKKAIDDGYKNIYVIVGTPLSVYSENSIFDSKNPLPFGIGKSLRVAARSMELLIHNALLSDIRLALKRNSIEGYRKLNIKVFGPEQFLYHSFEFHKVDTGLELSKKFVEFNLEEIL